MTSTVNPSAGRALTGLSGKVLILTIIFVMLGEVLIFLPSIANFRVQWLKTRIAQGEIAALATDATPDQVLDASLRHTLLKGAGVEAVAVMRDGKRSLMLSNDNAGKVEEIFDLRAGQYYTSVIPAFQVLLRDQDRLINVIDNPPAMTGNAIEIAVHEGPLREAMLNFGLRILALSVFLSLIVAGLIFTALNRVMVKPVQRLSANMMAFAQMPEDPLRVIEPSSRQDELGVAEHELQSMQRQLQNLLQQKTRLAALGLAVSKVSHDLRNMLTSAQLISDRLASVKDSRVQRFAPKLISSLDRAITFLNQTITYGRAQELPPRREIQQLSPLVDEVFDTLRLQAPRIKFVDDVPSSLKVDADREQLVRILTNLARNAIQAIETRPQKRDEVHISAGRQGKVVAIRVMDTGPGIPPAIRNKMFAAFQTAARSGGTGLGLAISSELAQAHGGSLVVIESAEGGTTFELNLPDRNGH
ncbi:MAG: HAMP domain-containing sensor histidine kinase [Aestuariivirga sp.]